MYNPELRTLENSVLSFFVEAAKPYVKNQTEVAHCRIFGFIVLNGLGLWGTIKHVADRQKRSI